MIYCWESFQKRQKKNISSQDFLSKLASLATETETGTLLVTAPPPLHPKHHSPMLSRYLTHMNLCMYGQTRGEAVKHRASESFQASLTDVLDSYRIQANQVRDLSLKGSLTQSSKSLSDIKVVPVLFIAGFSAALKIKHQALDRNIPSHPGAITRGGFQLS